MIPAPFSAHNWVERLAEALAISAQEQDKFREEFRLFRHESDRVQERLQKVPPLAVSDYLSSFLSDAYFGEGLDHEQHYGPLRPALQDVRDLLVEHPVFVTALPASDPSVASGRHDEFLLRLPDRSGHAWTTHILGGLLARAWELPEDGFTTACYELHSLLDPDAEGTPGDLNVGYHVTLFHGLQFEEEVPITKDMAIRPFDSMRAFVNEDTLDGVVPDLLTSDASKSVGAIVKPFRWKPDILPLTDQCLLDPDYGGSFREDAEFLVELLAVLHGASMTSLATIHYCINRVASGLLGSPHFHSSCAWGRRVGTIDRSAPAVGPDPAIMEQARNGFIAREGTRRDTYESVIARLAEALARNGRFALEDKILDVAIALERMYELDRGEIEFKLKTRAAYLLETAPGGRLQVFKGIGAFYNARSAIVHKPGRKRKKVDQRDAFSAGFDVARRSLVKLMTDGPPSDWNEILFE